MRQPAQLRGGRDRGRGDRAHARLGAVRGGEARAARDDGDEAAEPVPPDAHLARLLPAQEPQPVRPRPPRVREEDGVLEGATRAEAGGGPGGGGGGGARGGGGAPEGGAARLAVHGTPDPAHPAPQGEDARVQVAVAGAGAVRRQYDDDDDADHQVDQTARRHHRAIPALALSRHRALPALALSRHRALPALALSRHRALPALALSHHRALPALALSRQRTLLALALH